VAPPADLPLSTMAGTAAACETRPLLLLVRALAMLGGEWTSSGVVRRLDPAMVLAEARAPYRLQRGGPVAKEPKLHFSPRLTRNGGRCHDCLGTGLAVQIEAGTSGVEARLLAPQDCGRDQRSEAATKT